MLLVHIVGILVLVAGLWLFARSQIKGSVDPTISEANVLKVNVKGPPSLILVMVGLFVFLFPFLPWWPTPEPVEVPVTVPEQTTTTGTATTVTTTGPVETTVYAAPLSPYSYEVTFDPDVCEGYVVEWFTDPTPVGWFTVADVYSVETDEYVDEYVDSSEFDSNADTAYFPGEARLCEWEFFYGDGFYYWLYVYSYDGENYSEDALAIQYP